MISKKNRSNRKDIEQIFRFGRSVGSFNLNLRFIGDSKNKKISFIIPKTVSKKAVVRNLLRRRGYSVLKKHFNIKLPNIMGVFIFNKRSLRVFGGKKSKDNNPIYNLENEIKNIFKKI